MVLDLLFKSKDLEVHPLEMFIYSSIVTFLSAIFSIIVFSQYASVIFPFFITIALLPPMHKILYDQEKIEEDFANLPFMQRYKKILEIYSFFFLGVVFAVIFFISFMPSHYTDQLFSEQLSTISAIRENDISFQGNYYATYKEFLSILYNNSKVLFIAFMLSFFFGSGALYILSWNASVVGVFISYYARMLSVQQNTHILISHLQALFSISLHGIPEVMGYFLGGIAGAMLSFGLVEGNNRKIIIEDSFKVLTVSFFLILLGATIEAFIVPIL